MYFGVDYHPEHWVYPLAGSPDNPESRWQKDVTLMSDAGINIVRIGEFVWGLCEPREGEFNFEWLRRIMDLLANANIKVVLGTPTAAPPLWLTKKHPEFLPIDDKGLRLHGGTRHARCLNSSEFWDYSKKIITEMARALGNHSSLVAWQLDNGIGGHTTEFSYNPESEQDWHAWLKAKYQTLDRLNECLGNVFWSQIASDWKDVPMPMRAPTVHNPALVMDWMRFSSDTIVAYLNMQASLLKELTPGIPVTSNLRALSRHFDHFDAAEGLDFVGLDSYATIKSKVIENAMDLDMVRSLKKDAVMMPGGGSGFWVMEQKAGNVNWQDVNSLVRPDVVRLFTYQAIARGADAILYFLWRQPRIGSEKFYGGILNHAGRGDNRIYREICQIGEEMKKLGPGIAGSKVVSDVCFLLSHENMWMQKLPMQPNAHFKQRDHQLTIYRAFHERNIPVDFARPEDDLSRYKLVIAPSLQTLSGGATDRLKLYVQNGGTLVGTFGTGLMDEHSIVPDSGIPGEMTDLFGLEVEEFDPIGPDKENRLIFKGAFPTTHMHPATLWCDIINPRGCQVLATYAKDFYAGKPALTMNTYGDGRAIYVGTKSHHAFYLDLTSWLQQLCDIAPIMKVPESVEVSMRQKEKEKLYFLLNHHHSPVRLTFYRKVHDFLTGNTIEGTHDLPPNGVLVINEHPGEE